MRRRDLLRVGAGMLGSGAGVRLVGSGPRATAAAHPGPYEPYGRIDVEGAKEAVVGPDGDVAYLAATSGYAAVDVSVPDRPRLLADVREPLADRDGGPLRGIFDVKLDATDPTTLVVVGPANPRPGALAGALVVDVSDPETPVERAFYETSYPIHNCFVRDGVAYLTANDGDRNPLVLLDIATGDELGRFSLVDVDEAWGEVPTPLRSVHDVFVRGSTAFVALWDAGTWIVDVSDPTVPRVLGSVDAPDPSALAGLSRERARRESTLPPRNHHYVATDESGTLLGVGRESWALEADAAGNGSDALTPSTATDSAASTDSATSTGSTASDGSGTDGSTERYVGGPSGIDLWDVSDPGAPILRATIPPPPSPDPTYDGVWTTAHNFELAGGILYSAWYRGGVKRHDVSEPSAPRELSWWRDPNAASFWTAQVARAGDREGFFVASSWGVDDVPARLYTFPDHDGEQADPPSVLPDRTVTSVSRTGPATNGEREEDTAGGRSETPEELGGDTPTEPAGGVGIGAPGFGVVAGAGGIGLAAWRLRRRTRDNTGDD
ncbi:LVIVD repeat-containing protein [Halobellus sp. GM3]|uniref:LVIVD repeat-containing protein n=1 Tax=Halobellus sp. GM3 TaxID=3458410 RepID=UPI00403D5AB9